MMTFLSSKNIFLKSASIFSVVFSLLLVCVISYKLNVENNLNFPLLFLVTLVGFVVFNLSPPVIRKYILGLLSIGCALLVLNPINVFILYAVGSILFLISDSSFENKFIWAVLLASALILAIVRTKFNIEIIEPRLWVILSSIFMFRTILYVQQKKMIKSRLSKFERFNYFFLFPNIFSPLFPIIDFKDFSKKPNPEETSVLRIKGINLITTGLIQLIIYKIIYIYFLPPLSDVENSGTLLVYIITNYLLVFRLIGMFNICVGILRIFGFNLPEVFNNIFISTGVSDFFRRLNIYWKEFLLNVFYYPLYFKLRKMGMIKALAISSVITFILNWFFHAYQWFWILGTSSIRWTDTIFWFSFSFVAITEMIYQTKYAAKKKENLITTLTWPIKVILTFSFIAIIWSLWTAPSIEFWYTLIQNCMANNSIVFSKIIMLFVATYGMLLVFKKYINHHFENLFDKGHRRLYLYNLIILIILSVISCSDVFVISSDRISSFVAKISSEEKNVDDTYKLEEGYYDGILEFNVGSANWDVSMTQKVQKYDKNKIRDQKIILDDLRISHFKPNVEMLDNRNLLFKTNNLGLRSKNYPLVSDSNNLRVAFLGGSPESGLNLSNKDILVNIAEGKINQFLEPQSKTIELFNYTLAGYTMANYRKVLELDILKYKPKFVILTVRTREFFNAYTRVSKIIIKDGKKLDTSFESFLKENKIDLNTRVSKKIATGFGSEMWYWNINEVLKICNNNNITPIILYIPQLTKKVIEESNYEDLKSFALERKIKFIDLSTVYDGHEINSLTTSGKDIGNHPNVKGHKVIADLLTKELIDYFEFD